MSTTGSTKMKSTKVRTSSTRQKARLAVKRVAHDVVRHMARPRTGFEALIEPLARLAEKHSAEFATGIDVALMRASLKAYQDLEEDFKVAVNNLAMIENTRLLHSSTAWTQALGIYDRGRSLARFDKDIQAEIDPVTDFMKVGPRKAAEPVTTTPVATTTTP